MEIEVKLRRQLLLRRWPRSEIKDMANLIAESKRVTASTWVQGEMMERDLGLKSWEMYAKDKGVQLAVDF